MVKPPALIAFLDSPAMTLFELTEADYGMVNQVLAMHGTNLFPLPMACFCFPLATLNAIPGLWIYDYCNMGNFDETNEGSIYYDDEEGGCGDQANLTVLLEGGVPYWIRMGLGDADYDGLVGFGVDLELPGYGRRFGFGLDGQ